MNLLLLCHGGFKEFSNFDLGPGQAIQYRGNLGSALTEEAAAVLLQALLSDPFISEQNLRYQLPNYEQPEELEGPRTAVPNINLAGDDWLSCVAINQNNGRWIRLCGDWRSTLRDVVADLQGGPCWINLLCCSEIAGANIVRAAVHPMVKAPNWNNFLH